MYQHFLLFCCKIYYSKICKWFFSEKICLLKKRIFIVLYKRAVIWYTSTVHNIFSSSDHFVLLKQVKCGTWCSHIGLSRSQQPPWTLSLSLHCIELLLLLVPYQGYPLQLSLPFDMCLNTDIWQVLFSLHIIIEI